jgi:hypothetical protein
MTMRLEITDAAAAIIARRGGTVTIDFLRPTG